MNIRLNNNDEKIDGDKITISQLLEIKKYTFKMLVVKVNNEVVKREDYQTATISDGDDVMVLHLMSGG
jgi:thiamine biosynthesis protein ThiS